MEEEISVITAIYCGDGEFELVQQGNDVNPCIIIINVKCSIAPDSSQTKDAISVRLTFSIGPDYPKSLPEISIQSDSLTREKATGLKEKLLDYLQEIVGNYVILEAVQWIQDNICDYAKEQSTNSELCNQQNRENFRTVLLHLDHMRAKVKYVKIIQKWTEELALVGRLIFHNNLIFILLQGLHRNIKEYISRQRTVNVDVDSKGRSCKERMIKVVADLDLEEDENRFREFLVEEVDKLHDVKCIFGSIGLDSVFENHVLAFYKK